jgi:hypothetical protein
MFLAWNVRAEAGFERDEREADVRERHIGERDVSSEVF